MFSTGIATFAFSVFCSILLYLIFALVIYQLNIGDLIRNIVGLIIITICFSFFSWYISSRHWSVNPLFINIVFYFGLALILIRDSYNTMSSAFGFFLSGSKYNICVGQIILMERGTTGFPQNIYLTILLWLLPLIFIYYFSKAGLKHKLLNIKCSSKKDSFILFFNAILFVIISFLMFGNCQNSKYHYLFQGIIRIHSLPNDLTNSYFQFHKTGIWRDWYINGNIKTNINYSNGFRDGKCEGWYLNGSKEYEEIWKSGTCLSRIDWNEMGRIMTKEELSIRAIQRFKGYYQPY